MRTSQVLAFSGSTVVVVPVEAPCLGSGLFLPSVTPLVHIKTKKKDLDGADDAATAAGFPVFSGGGVGQQAGVVAQAVEPKPHKKQKLLRAATDPRPIRPPASAALEDEEEGFESLDEDEESPGSNRAIGGSKGQAAAGIKIR